MPRDEAASLQHASQQEEVMYQLSPHYHHPGRSGEGAVDEDDAYSVFSEATEEEDEEIVFIVDGSTVKQQQQQHHHHHTKKATPARHHQATQASTTTFVPASGGAANTPDSDGYSRRSAVLLLTLSMAVLLGVLAVVVMVFNDSTINSSSSRSSSSLPHLSQNTDPLLQIPSSPSSSSAAAASAWPVQKNPVSYETESILPTFAAEEGMEGGAPSASASKAATSTEENMATGIIVAAAAVGDATAAVLATAQAEAATNATAPALPTVNSSSSSTSTSSTSSISSLSDPLHLHGLRGLQDRPSVWMDALSRLAAALEEAVDRFEHGRRKEGREEGGRMKPTTAEGRDEGKGEEGKKGVDGAVTS